MQFPPGPNGPHTCILTDLERKRIRRYLKADGEKDVNIRQLVMRHRKDKEKIRDDLALLDQLLKNYERH
jgi:hypothetical protein